MLAIFWSYLGYSTTSSDSTYLLVFLSGISVCRPKKPQFANNICKTAYCWKSHSPFSEFLCLDEIHLPFMVSNPSSFLIQAVVCLAYLYLSLYPTSLFKKPLLKLSFSCCSDPVRHSYSNQTLHSLTSVHSSSLKSKAQKNTTHTYSFAFNLLYSF